MSEFPPDDAILDPLDQRHPGISVAGILIGLVVGLCIGLVYAWQIDPVIVRNTAPNDLQADDKQTYIVAIAQEYGSNQNLARAVERLLIVEPNENPFEAAAETACQLIRSGRVSSVTDIAVIQNLRAIYEPQGITSPCDTSAFNTPVPVTIIVPTPTITFTPSLTPVATKTPTQPVNPQPLNTPIATSTLSSRDGTLFREAFVEQFCDANINGVIEVYVRESNTGIPLPGIPLEIVDSDRNRAIFYTGLKPERGDDYADFEMEAGQSYRVTVPEQGQPSRELVASTCDADGTLTSYRLVIQRVDVE